MSGGGCYVPLGAGPCGCPNGDGTTIFIRRVDVNWEDASLTYHFQDEKRAPERITEPADVSMCLSAILEVYIPLARDAKEGDEIVEFWVDGEEVGLKGAVKLLAMRKLHTAMYHLDEKK